MTTAPPAWRARMGRACSSARSTSATPTGSCWSSPASPGNSACPRTSRWRRQGPRRRSPPEAMTRLRQIPRAEVTSGTILRYYQALFGDRDPVAAPGTATGTPGDWWSVFANSEDVFTHAVNGFGLYRGPRKLDPILRELGQTRVGWATGSQFVFSQHCKSLRGLKVSEA